MNLCGLTVTYFPSIYHIDTEVMFFKRSTQHSGHDLQSRFWRQKPASLQLAPLDPSVIQGTFRIVRHTAAAKTGQPLPVDCSCIQPRVSSCVPLPPVNLGDVSHFCFPARYTCWLMGRESNAATAASVMQGAGLQHSESWASPPTAVPCCWHEAICSTLAGPYSLWHAWSTERAKPNTVETAM